MLSKSGTRLGRYPYFDTSDLEIADVKLTAEFGPTRLRLLDRTSRFRAWQNRATVQSIGISYAGSDATVGVTTYGLDSSFVVAIPIRGKCRICHGSEEVLANPGVGWIASPGRPIQLTWEAGCTVALLQIGRGTVERRLGSLLGRQLKRPLEFSVRMPTTSRRLATWYQAVNLLFSDVQRGAPLTKHPPFAVNLEQTIVHGLLCLQPHTFSNNLIGPVSTGSAHQVRRVLELIEAHPERALTVDTLAAEVTLSARSLHAAFRRELDTTPMRYLREVRMARIHADLVAAQNDPTIRITDIAARWGMTHLGHFASAYRKLYHETPTETLRRRRR